MRGEFAIERTRKNGKILEFLVPKKTISEREFIRKVYPILKKHVKEVS